ncbi:MAG TPA: TonB family protein [Verrucomicrobiae bacterium]
MVTTQEPAKLIVKVPPASLERCALGEACPTRLTCELARQCLPQDKPDPNVKYAWANAICVLFILIGLYGLKSPLFILPAEAKAEEVVVPVLFMPPPPSMQSQSLAPASESAPAPDSIAEPMEMPEVAPAVAPENANVAFAVPVEGPVRVVAAQYAAAPPVIRKVVAPPPPGPTGNGTGGTGDAVEFSPGGGDGGKYPQPTYPALALSRGYQGVTVLEIVVDRTGFPSSISVRDSSGWDILDDEAAYTVKRKWRWPAGPQRHYLVPFKFQINQKK